MPHDIPATWHMEERASLLENEKIEAEKFLCKVAGVIHITNDHCKVKS